jgi:arginase
MSDTAAPAIAFVGAPSDAGASVRGSSMGPDALRVAGLCEALAAQALRVHDRGNLAGPVAAWGSHAGGVRHLEQVVAWNRAVYAAVDEALRRGELPMMVGGDHSLAVGSISAVARHCRATRKSLRVVWLDAHSDINTEAISPSGNLHGMPVSCLLGHGPPALVGWSGETAALTPAQIDFVGVRSVDAAEKQAVRQLGLQVFDMRHIDEHGMRNTMTEVLQDMDEDTHLHVSFDVDCLDPRDAPAVGTAVPGGPTYREMQLCMEMLADTRCLGSVDIVELNPALDVRNQTAALVVDLVTSLFGKSTLVR